MSKINARVGAKREYEEMGNRGRRQGTGEFHGRTNSNTKEMDKAYFAAPMYFEQLNDIPNMSKKLTQTVAAIKSNDLQNQI